MLNIKRREFIAVVGGGLLLAAKVNRAQGQPSGKTYRIGFLGVFSHEDYRPGVTQAGIIRNPANPAGLGLLGGIQAAGQSLGIEVTPISVGHGGEIGQAVAASPALLIGA